MTKIPEFKNDATLRDEPMQQQQYLVENLIPTGLTLLAGKPKTGKSWLVQDLALAIADTKMETTILGNQTPKRGQVLYLGLEDSEQRLKLRSAKIRADTKQEATQLLHYTTEWPLLNKGGLQLLEDAILRTTMLSAVIIDCLVAIKPPRDTRETHYESDYRALQQLQQLTRRTETNIIVVHHTRKADDDDPQNTISGTLGLAACADTNLILTKTNLHVRSRNTEDQDLAITFNKTTCRWTILGTAEETRRSETRGKILAAFNGNPLSPKELVLATGLELKTIEQHLYRMLRNGDITRTNRGTYYTA